MEANPIVVTSAVASHQNGHLRVSMVAYRTQHVNLKRLIESLLTAGRCAALIELWHYAGRCAESIPNSTLFWRN
jgi:hypothetical protein